MMNCVGPTVPIVSGGQPEQSGKVAAVKLSVGLAVCAAKGDVTGDDLIGVALVVAEAFKGGSMNRGAKRRGWGCVAQRRSRAMICAVVSRTPVAPVCGVPTMREFRSDSWALKARLPIARLTTVRESLSENEARLSNKISTIVKLENGYSKHLAPDHPRRQMPRWGCLGALRRTPKERP